jgi:1-acyl-sn-glycerol-3-phosphate acyltransferase
MSAPSPPASPGSSRAADWQRRRRAHEGGEQGRAWAPLPAGAPPSPGPAAAAERPADRLIAGCVRLVLRIFFRSVEVVGAERLPRGRPLVLVANHVNGLIDPLLILGPLPVTPRFLGKSTLWKNLLVRPLLELARAIPVYRRHDEGVDPRRNRETFAQCHELLAAGGAVALFPEGVSHSEPSLQPLKTGAARIVLEAAAKFPGLGVRIVPVGLVFDAKETFRSRALVTVGEPIDPAAEVARYAADRPGAVRALTARVDAALQEVTLNYASWEEARRIARAADLYDRPAPDLPGGRPLAECFALQRALVAGRRELERRFPERVAAVAESVRAYDHLLRVFGLRDDQVAAAYPASPVARFVARVLLRLLVHLPLGVAGTLLNWPTYRLVGAGVRRATQDRDQVATYKLFGALLLFPATWLLEAVLAGWWVARAGSAVGAWTAALLTLAAAPATGWAALLFHESRALFWREARAYLVLRTRRRLAAELKAKRAEVVREVEELAALYGAGEGSTSD